MSAADPQLDRFLRETAAKEREEEIERVLGKAFKLDLFDVLALGPEATKSDVTKQFRRLSLLVHPDKVGEALKERARKAQALLTAAKNDYADEDKRAYVVARYAEAKELVERARRKKEKEHRKEFKKLMPAGTPPPIVWPVTLEEEVRAAAKELIIDEEWRRRQMQKKAAREETRAREEKERRRKEAEERRKAEAEWEEGREGRVSSWRSFDKKRTKKKRLAAGARTGRTLDADEVAAKRRRLEEEAKRAALRASGVGGGGGASSGSTS